MRLLFVGDVMLGRLVNENLKRQSFKYPWGDTLDIFKAADFRVCNLECVIADHGEPWQGWPKAFHFRTDRKNINVLKVAEINAVSIANNHTLDFGYQAMFEMLKHLRNYGILYAGAGKNLAEASKLATANIRGTKIGFLAFTDNEPEWVAEKDKAGIFYTPVDLKNNRTKSLFELIKTAKTNCDLLIVSAHWGPNWGYQPKPNHILFAHTLINAGVDIIFGHSCHVFQGIEIYKNKPILYSCGDFIDDYAIDEIERNDQSFIFTVETENSKIKSLKLYPTIIENFQVRRAKDRQAVEIVNKMTKLCLEFKTKTAWLPKEGYLEIKY